MSFINGYTGLFGGTGFGTSALIVTDQTPSPTDQPAEVQEPLTRVATSFGPLYGGLATDFNQCVIGSEGRYRGFDPCPTFDAALCWRMRADDTINLAFTVVTGPILAGTRSYECVDDRGNPDEAERIRKNLETDVLPIFNKALPGALECLHFEGWIQEIVHGRKNNRTMPIDVRPILPLEAVLHQDNTRRFAGYEIAGQKRDARYAFLAVNQPHIDSVRGYSRNRNAMAAWWRKEQSQKNADRVERKASGIQMQIAVPGEKSFYVTDPNDPTKQIPIMPMAMAQKIADHAAQGDVFVTPLTPFTKEAIQSNAALADIEAVKVKQFDWGNNGPALDAHGKRISDLNIAIFRAWCRPEREALEGTHGTKAEAGTHGAIGTTDSELVHASVCAQWDEQQTNLYLRTNEDPAWIGCFRVKPAPLSDPQQEFLQKIAEVLAADTATGEDFQADIDKRSLLERVEMPLLSEEDAQAVRGQIQQKQDDQQKQQQQAAQVKAKPPSDSPRVQSMKRRLERRLSA